ncbi:MAG: GNAT family N-acetyltransferase [Rhodobacteraceae bacterium]|nr:GNAT family N-acetyltransferase [Paracoccaceae bacterium]
MTPSIRDASPLDAGACGDILWRFQDDTDWMPKLHSAAETISFCDRMIAQGLVRVITSARVAHGFLARRGEEILSLYVTPQGQGLGQRLLQDAQAASQRLTLWTFQANHGAQRFYLRHGFVEIARSDGQDNDEGLPDIRYQWERSA